MLASIQDFINDLTSWLPQALENIGQLIVYFALLTALMMIPIGLWFVWAFASTRRRTATR
jgi:hypothetical protein